MKIDKVVRLGKTEVYAGKRVNVFVHIEYIDGQLSLTGVEGPKRNGDAWGSCGQILLTKGQFCLVDYAPGWTAEKVNRLAEVWKEWHRNDMQAGTPAQTAYLKAHKAEFPGYPVSHYTWACDVLSKAGLNPDNGYKYGSAWLRVDVPGDVLQWLASLPETDVEPAWV